MKYCLNKASMLFLKKNNPWYYASINKTNLMHENFPFIFIPNHFFLDIKIRINFFIYDIIYFLCFEFASGLNMCWIWKFMINLTRITTDYKWNSIVVILKTLLIINPNVLKDRERKDKVRLKDSDQHPTSTKKGECWMLVLVWTNVV